MTDPPLTDTRPVSREVGRFLIDRDVKGLISNRDLQKLINDEIVPFVSRRVLSLLAPFSAQKTVEYLGARLGQASRIHAGALVHGRQGVSQEIWQHSVLQASGNSRTWQLILEMALTNPPAGSKSLRGLDERRLLRLANDLYFWSQLSDRLHYSLADPTLEIDSSGGSVTGLHRVMDLGLWDLRLSRWMKSRDPDEQFGRLGELTLAIAQEREPPDSEYAARVDAVFTSSLGFALSTLLGLMSALAKKSGSLVSRSSEIIKRYELDAWVAAQGFPGDSGKATDFLVFYGHPEPWVASHLYESRQRLNTHPLPALPNSRVLVIPSWVATSASIYSKYLVEAAWPASRSEEIDRTDLRSLLEDEERALNRLLEIEIVERLWELGYPAYGPLKSGDQIGIPTLKLPGEIDVIAVDATNRRIVVIEAKDERQLHSTKAISRQVRKWWFGENSHAAKLRNKVSAVSASAASIPRAVVEYQKTLQSSRTPPHMSGDLGDVRHWGVVGVIVSPEPTNAGVYVERSLSSVWLGDLPRFLAEGEVGITDSGSV